MARTVIVTIGTRGDVVPYTALGFALAAAGDQVAVATHPHLRRHVDEAGLGFFPLPDLDTGRPLTSSRLAKMLAARWLDVGRAILAAAADADLLLLAPLGWLGYHVAQTTGAATMGAYLQPLEPTTAFPPPLLTTRSLGGWGNRTAARAFRLLGQLPFARSTADFRRELGLSPQGPAAMFRQMQDEQWPILYGFSPSVVPTPPDWPAYRPMTGYWWPPTGPELSPRVRQFLDEGEPPVFIGFGSMVAPGLDQIVDQALARLGRRAVVQRGATALTVDRKDVLVIGEEPHAELFPRVAAVVHHGGAGTTAAIEAGPSPVPLKSLTPQRLAQAIDEAEGFRSGAVAVSRRLAQEDGIGTAVRLIRQ